MIQPHNTSVLYSAECSFYQTSNQIQLIMVHCTQQWWCIFQTTLNVQPSQSYL